MLVREAMTPKVIGVQEDARLADAVDTMLKAGISALFVFDAQKRLVGVLSEGDLLRRGELGTEGRRPYWLELLLSGGRLAHSYAHSHGRRVAEVMTKDVLSIADDADLSAAVDLMTRRRVKRLPVVREGAVVGVLSRSDLLKRLYAALPRDATPKSDAEIEAAIRAEIDAQGWAPRASVQIAVKNGEVTFEGAITDDRLRDGLRVIAENIAGVTAVHDRLAWIEPNSGFLIPAQEEPKS